MTGPACPSCGTAWIRPARPGEACLRCRQPQGSGPEQGWVAPARRPPKPVLEGLGPGRYRAVGELGRGGAGVVYLAEDQLLTRSVALKVLFEGPGGAVESHGRFEREARTAARFDHPGLVRVYDVGIQDGRRIIAMEVVPGPSLREVVVQCGPLPFVVAARWVAQAAAAVAVAHAGGVVHRDLKPENLLLDAEGRVVVTDFGIAFVADAEGPRLTATGSLLGTPAYLAPEQLVGISDDPRIDVYGLGCVLYELLVGHAPYPEQGALAVLSALMRGPPTPLTALRSDCPGPLAAVVERAMARRPADRYASAADMAADLEDWLGGVRLTVDLPARRRARRRWMAAGLVGLSLLGALAFAGWSLSPGQAREEDAERRRAAMWTRAERLRAAGDDEGADEAFLAFVELEEVQGASAVAAAWRQEGERRAALGDRAGARSALARAYELATHRDQAQQSLVSLGDLLVEDWNWVGLAQVVSTLRERGESAERLEALEVVAALARRDLAAAGRTGLDALAGLRHARSVGPLPLHAAKLPDGEGALVFGPSIPDVRWLRLDEQTTELGRWQWPEALGGPLVLAGQSDGRGGLVVAAGHTRFGHEVVVLWSLQVGQEPARLLEVPGASALDLQVIDTTGQGQPTFFVGTGPYDRRLIEIFQGPEGWAWRQPAPALDAPKSDVSALLPWAWDADPAQELVVGLGPWTAFDLRLVDRDPRGFSVIARRKLGHITTLGRVRTPEGPRIAALHRDQFPSLLQFPADRPVGERPGLWLLTDRLDLAGWQGFATPLNASPSRMLPADVDGDGFDEVFLFTDQGHTVLQRITPEPAVWRFEGLHPLLTAQLDADPADEVLVVVDGVQGYWWGLGEGDLPLLALNAPAPVDPVEVEPALRSAWARVEELVGMGLWEDAAHSFERLGRVAETDRSAVEAWLRAAELWLLAGRGDRALRAWREAGPDPRAVALEVAYLLDRGQGDLAVQQAARLGPDQALPPELAARLPSGPTLRRFRPDLKEDYPPEFLFQHRAWVSPRPDGLLVTTFGDDPRLLAVPVSCDPDLLAIEVDLTVLAADWASGLAVDLVDAAGEVVAGVAMTLTGGGGIYQKEAICFGRGGSYRHLYLPEAGPDLSLRLSTSGEGWRCAATHGAYAEERVDLRAPFTGGDLELRVGWTSRVSGRPMSQSTALLRSLVVSGCEARSGPREDPPEFERVWASRRNEEDLLAKLVPFRSRPGAETELRRALRSDPVRFYPALEALLGPTSTEELAESAWQVALFQHPDRADLAAALTEILVPIEPRPTLLKANLLSREGKTSEALALLGRVDVTQDPGLPSEVALGLAQVYARAGEDEAALAAAGQALRLAAAPEIMADRFRASPELAGLLERPAWAALLSEAGAGPPLSPWTPPGG